jgi:hypothetical protein
MSRMICAASAAVSVDLVGAAWTLPDRYSTCTCNWSKPFAVLGSPISQSTPINTTPSRRKGQRMQQTAGADMLRLGALQGVTRPYLCGDVAGLPGPERQSPDQGGCFMPAEMSTERGHSVVTLPEDATAKVAVFGMQRQSASPFPRLKSKPHRMRNAPPAGRAVSGAIDCPLRSTGPLASPLKMQRH